MKHFSIATLIIIMAITTVNAQKTIHTWNKNQAVAHRGAWKKNNLPENSIASLKQAIKLNCYGSEFDVHLTLDSVIVVNHDPTFLGINIAKSTYKQLLEKNFLMEKPFPRWKSI